MALDQLAQRFEWRSSAIETLRCATTTTAAAAATTATTTGSLPLCSTATATCSAAAPLLRPTALVTALLSLLSLLSWSTTRALPLRKAAAQPRDWRPQRQPSEPWQPRQHVHPSQRPAQRAVESPEACTRVWLGAGDVEHEQEFECNRISLFNSIQFNSIRSAPPQRGENAHQFDLLPLKEERTRTGMHVWRSGTGDV